MNILTILFINYIILESKHKLNKNVNQYNKYRLY